jgi:hypothetical protein
LRVQRNIYVQMLSMPVLATNFHNDTILVFLQPSLSTEELNAEMKNLEGLMRDLSSISHHSNAANFKC